MSVTADPRSDLNPDKLDRPRFFIDGAWVEPSRHWSLQALEAATGEALGSAALGAPADIDAAVVAARHAFDRGPWGRMGLDDRLALLERFADALEARGETTSHLVSRENGMPIGLSALYNGQAPAALVRLNIQYARELAWERARPSARGATVVRRVPVGVVAAITPWNYPQLMAGFKVAPALAAGCTVVLKPSPETALDSYVFAEAAQEAGLPEGVLNIVLADRDAGATLVSHPGVDKIAFTGSTAAGRVIGAEAGGLIRRCTLELGGKSASIVCDDADLEVFVAGLPYASMLNNAQTCTTQGRLLAPRSRYDEVVDAVAGFCRDQTIGDPLDPTVTCGPMVSESQQQRVLGYIDQARDSDARLVVGGGRPAHLDRGWFVEPTVFANVDNRATLAQEEVFGPVLAVIAYDDDDEAIAIANDSVYGLAGSVWTSDEQRGLDIARRVRTGTIGINYYEPDLGAPFGGMKDSGVGRELGPEGLDAYLDYQSIYTSTATAGMET